MCIARCWSRAYGRQAARTSRVMDVRNRSKHNIYNPYGGAFRILQVSFGVSSLIVLFVNDIYFVDVPFYKDWGQVRVQNVGENA